MDALKVEKFHVNTGFAVHNEFTKSFRQCFNDVRWWWGTYWGIYKEAMKHQVIYWDLVGWNGQLYNKSHMK